MVVHETYRDAEGLGRAGGSADRGRRRGRRAFKLDGGAPIEIGAIEKMSKSKRNTVDPDEIITTYGADTARWFMLSDSPPERDVIWTEAGVQGAFKQTQRFWRLVCEIERVVGESGRRRPRRYGEARRHPPRRAWRARQDRGRYRAAALQCRIATIYEFANALAAAIGAIEAAPVADDLRYAFAEAGDMLVQGFAPMMPHLAEECWEALGHETLVAQSPWPAVDRCLIVATHVTLPVQINGRKRADVTVARDADAKRSRARRWRSTRSSGRWIIGRPGKWSSCRTGSSMSWSRASPRRSRRSRSRRPRRLLPAALRRGRASRARGGHARDRGRADPRPHRPLSRRRSHHRSQRHRPDAAAEISADGDA